MKLNVYIGYDSRETIPYLACKDSIRDNLSSLSFADVDIFGLDISLLERDGIYTRRSIFPDETASTEFAFTRFLVPYLNNYEGYAIFVDCDFIFLDDITKLIHYISDYNAVSVVKHDYTPKFGVKMDGQKQVSYPKKNWSSLMLFNCSHLSAKTLTPEVVSNKSGAYLHRFEWCAVDEIGNIPITWNWLEGEYDENTLHINQISSFEELRIRAVHYTNGGVWFPEVCHARRVDFWKEYMIYAHQYMSNNEILDVVTSQLNFEKKKCK